MSNTQIHQNPAFRPSGPPVGSPPGQPTQPQYPTWVPQPILDFNPWIIKFVYWTCRVTAFLGLIFGGAISVSLIFSGLSAAREQQADAGGMLIAGFFQLIMTLAGTAAVLWFAAVLSLLSKIEFNSRQTP